MLERKKLTVILSGGMDSMTLLYWAIQETEINNINALSVNYGQKHKKELVQATKLCKELKINHRIVNISEVQELLESSLTRDDKEVPEGHYAKDNMKQTVVPNRNAIMLSIAYGYAISTGSDFVLFGAHAGDHFIYPDCRPLFTEALDVALQIGNEGFGKVRLVAPFIYKSKSDICRLGLELGVPYEETWSCYKGDDRPCLKCGTCVERTEAFVDNETQDPLLTDKEWNQATEYHAQAMKEHKRVK